MYLDSHRLGQILRGLRLPGASWACGSPPEVQVMGTEEGAVASESQKEGGVWERDHMRPQGTASSCQPSHGTSHPTEPAIPRNQPSHGTWNPSLLDNPRTSLQVPVSERGDDEASAVPEVLVAIQGLGI